MWRHKVSDATPRVNLRWIWIRKGYQSSTILPILFLAIFDYVLQATWATGSGGFQWTISSFLEYFDDGWLPGLNLEKEASKATLELNTKNTKVFSLTGIVSIILWTCSGLRQIPVSVAIRNLKLQWVGHILKNLLPVIPCNWTRYLRMAVKWVALELRYIEQWRRSGSFSENYGDSSPNRVLRESTNVELFILKVNAYTSSSSLPKNCMYYHAVGTLE